MRLYRHSKREVYSNPPPGVGVEGEIWKAAKPLNGLCDAPQQWCNTLIDFLKNQFKGVASGADKGCYYRTEKAVNPLLERK